MGILEVSDQFYDQVQVIDQGVVTNADPTLGRNVDAYVLEFVFTHDPSETRHAIAVTPPTLMDDEAFYAKKIREGKLIVLAQAGVL